MYSYRAVVFLIAFIYLLPAWADIVIECEYKNETVVTLNNYDNTLTCFAKISSGLTEPQGSPVKIVPTDEIQRHSQVEHFRLVDQDISNHFDNIVKAIAENFPKVRGVILGNVSISHVTKDHLKSFPELELISLDNNKIKVLDSDLFTYTPKMKFIYFDFNRISTVDNNLFNSLDIVEVEFSSNPCIELSTCKSQLNYEKLKDTNPDLFHYYELYQAMNAVLEKDPNYGR